MSEKINKMIHQHYKSIFTVLILPLVIAITALSCSKMDDYKKYTANGEITYVGKVDSLEIRSGYNRVQIYGLFIADPKISSCRIYRDDRADSITVTVKRTNGVDTLDLIIEGLSEGAHTFEVVTFDASGNRSVAATGSCNVYGERYVDGLLNRPIASGVLDESGDATITWGDFDVSGGALGTQHTYTDENDNQVSLFSPVDQASTVMAGYKSGTTFTYRTAYLPDSTCIDTLYAATQTTGVKTDITAAYIKNAGPPILAASSGGRWGIPADWMVSDDVKNSGGYGGLDAGSWLPGAALSIEAGWGLPEVPNGKIYQTFTLPAGKYVLEVTTGDCSDGGPQKYITVAEGATLPDIDDVPDMALQHMGMVKFALNKLEFELTEDMEISVGVQAKLPDTGTYLKVFQVRLFSLPD